ncbi:uncharacterized protein BDZ99DRAFT_531059 [Mytilinidion resinicola]|uniref:Uncharacterized protein n=1 Tax=Mytilinidion resinicola TaxID=574789 RepID=A0A6A6ZAR8_9PEZI|nr:uncharacterized protein BDZ99DRAFT_531059 [Mytilinidion resinicola]KAF2817799.1 hypothetical protein BDZ99DRAFT_531059 [Mytilinidion resinicola]
MQKTDYHLTRRHLKEKRVVLAKNSRAGLHSLVNFCSYPSYADRTEKVVIGLEAYFLALATDQPDRVLVRAPESSPQRDRQRIADIGLVLASLEAMPALNTVELVYAPAGTSNTSESSSEPLLSASEQESYFDMFCKGLVAVGKTIPHLHDLAKLFNVPFPALSALVKDRTSYHHEKRWAPRHNPCFKSLCTLKIHVDPDMLYRDWFYDFGLCDLLIKSAPALDTLDVNGSRLEYEHDDANRPLWQVSVRLDVGPYCLTSVTLRNVQIMAYHAPFGGIRTRTLRQLTLEGVMVVGGPKAAFNIIVRLKGLTRLIVRAVFDLRPIDGAFPWAFGTLTEEMELMDFFFLGARGFEEAREMWRNGEVKVSDIPGSEQNRDLIGWKFEGGDVAAGARFLAENGRVLQQ